MYFIEDNYVFLAAALCYLSRAGSVSVFVKSPIEFIFVALMYSSMCEFWVDILIRKSAHPAIAAIIVVISCIILCLRVSGKLVIMEDRNGPVVEKLVW